MTKTNKSETAETIALADCALSLSLSPACGGAIAQFALNRDDGRPLDLFDTRPHPSRTGPFALGCNILAPFANRISGGGFWHDGVFHELKPNIAGEPYPNHGNAFSSAWEVAGQTASSASLSLVADGPGAFRYEAKLDYALRDGGLDAVLWLTNRGDFALPFGGGFHPWFARTPRASMRFRSAGVWTETADHLPDRFIGVDDAAEHDYRNGQDLPDGFTNVAYSGWDGEAEITWPEEGMGLRMTAEAPLRVLMLYTPGREAPFFSLEPVSHTVNAHNREGDGVVKPAILQPGESLRLAMRLEPHKIA